MAFAAPPEKQWKIELPTGSPPQSILPSSLATTKKGPSGNGTSKAKVESLENGGATIDPETPRPKTQV